MTTSERRRSDVLPSANAGTGRSLTRCVTVSFSYEIKPKKIKTENDKKAKKRKPEEVGDATELRFQRLETAAALVFKSRIKFRNPAFFSLFSLGHQDREDEKQKRGNGRWKEESEEGAGGEVEVVSGG